MVTMPSLMEVAVTPRNDAVRGAEGLEAAVLETGPVTVVGTGLPADLLPLLQAVSEHPRRTTTARSDCARQRIIHPPFVRPGYRERRARARRRRPSPDGKTQPPWDQDRGRRRRRSAYRVSERCDASCAPVLSNERSSSTPGGCRCRPHAGSPGWLRSVDPEVSLLVGPTLAHGLCRLQPPGAGRRRPDRRRGRRAARA